MLLYIDIIICANNIYVCHHIYNNYFHISLTAIVIYFVFSSCGFSLDLEALKYTYAMAFAVEEINHHSTLLPGVKLGYHILDSCGIYPWSLQSAMSMVGGDTQHCNLTAFMPRSAAYKQPGETAGTT